MRGSQDEVDNFGVKDPLAQRAFFKCFSPRSLSSGRSREGGQQHTETNHHEVCKCEDERHFSRTGITVSHRRARMYPENVERNFILSKVLQFFGFVLYPGMDFSDCTPNKLFRDNIILGSLSRRLVTERMFKKWLSFKLSAAPAEPDIEESSADVTDLMSAQGEQFEVGDSDSEDEDLEFIDSFL